MRRIFIDNFEDVLRWDSAEVNATALVEISDVKPFRGGGCLHILNTDSTPTDAGRITINTIAMLTEHKIYNLSGEMRFGTKTNLDKLEIIMGIIVDGFKFKIGLRYDVINSKFYYTHSDGNWELVFDSDLSILANTWFTFKIEVDIGKAKMRQVSIAGKEQEIKTALFGAVEANHDRRCELTVISHQEGTTAGMEYWLDSIRLEGR